MGDPDSAVGRVLVALDATASMVRSAHDAGANVLLAHHPVYIAAPDAFVPRAGSTLKLLPLSSRRLDSV